MLNLSLWSGIPPLEFFRWLADEFKVLPSLLTSSADYGAALAIEATFNLLESQGCAHYPALSVSRIRIDNKARTQCSNEVTKCAQSFCRQY